MIGGSITDELAVAEGRTVLAPIFLRNSGSDPVETRFFRETFDFFTVGLLPSSFLSSLITPRVRDLNLA